MSNEPTTKNPQDSAMSLQERLIKDIWEYLGDTTMICTKDWSAWQYGTMKRDDFDVARDDDDFMDSIKQIIAEHLQQEIQKAKVEARKEALREMDKAWVLCMGKNADASDLRHLRVEAGINL